MDKERKSDKNGFASIHKQNSKNQEQVVLCEYEATQIVFKGHTKSVHHKIKDHTCIQIGFVNQLLRFDVHEKWNQNVSTISEQDTIKLECIVMYYDVIIIQIIRCHSISILEQWY